MKWIRRLHAWLGVGFAPSIVVFVLSGLLQMWGAHEGEDGSEPAGWIVRLAQLHMKQTIELPRRRGPAPAPTATATAAPPKAAAAEPPPPRRPRPTTMPLKLVFTLMSLGLLVSTGLGVYMAFTPKRDRRLMAVLLAAGVVVPIALMML